MGQHQSGSLALLRADGAKDVGEGIALVLRRHLPCAVPRPASGDLVLLAYAVDLLRSSTIGEPDLKGLGLEARILRNACHRGWGLF